MKKCLLFSKLLFALIFITGCGSQTPVRGFNGSGEAQLSSIDSINSPTTQGAKALCNVVSSSAFRGKIQLFRFQGSMYANTQQLRIDSITSEYKDSQSVLEINRWSLSSGQVEKVSFYFEDRLSQSPVSGVLKSVSATDIGTLSQKFYGQVMNPSQFFSRVHLVLMNVSANEWDAIRVSYHQNETLITETDVLIPVFPADPTELNLQNRSALVDLHPLKGLAPGSNFGGSMNQFCF